MTRMAQDAGTQTAEQRKTSTGADLRALGNKTLSVVASVVRLLCILFAAVLVVHVVLFVAGANPVNAITVFFNDAANQLTLGIGDLFVPQSESLRAILNYGLAAVVWIVIGIVLSKVLSAFVR